MIDIPFGSKGYLSGPMTGVEDYNMPMFFYWQVKLEKSGYRIDNPALYDLRKMRTGWVYSEDQWDSIIAEDCEILKGCDFVFVLNGWQDSPGALIEIECARREGIPVYYEEYASCKDKGVK